MTMIGVDQAPGELRLHSCPACGRHAWRNGEREVDRSELLASLRAAKVPPPAVRPEPTVAAAAPASGDGDRRAELQRLLSGFTVHGTTS